MTDPSKANDRFDRMIAAIEQHRREYPPERSAAEQAENDALVAKYPGQFVAYTDDWDGERLTRRVLATGRSSTDVHAQIDDAHYEAVRHKLTVREIEDPNDPEGGDLHVWSTWLEGDEPRPGEVGNGEPRLPG